MTIIPVVSRLYKISELKKLIHKTRRDLKDLFKDNTIFRPINDSFIGLAINLSDFRRLKL